MEKSILKNYYRPMLEQNSFRPIPCPEKFGPAGQCWELDPAVGSGYYWVYAKRDLFDIKIHDFCFHQDFCMEMDIPECISIQRYDSISGEELNPYRRLSAGDIQTIVGGRQRYRAIIHQRIPIHAVGVEILPAYYEDFLKKQYPDLYFDLPAAFQSVDQAADFPAMSKLLFEVENYRGEGSAADLFYEAKVTEAIALVVDAWKRQGSKRERPLSAEDLAGLQNVVSYISDHYAFDIPLARLAGIACMSERAEDLLQAAAGLHRHAVHPGPPYEPGGASADPHGLHHGPDRPDDRLHHLQPLRRALQKKHRPPAHGVPASGNRG